MTLKQKIQLFIEENQDEYIALLKEMVRHKSVAGQESHLQSLIADRLQKKGFDVDKWDLDYHELSKNDSFSASRSDFIGSPNLVGVLKGTGEGRSIILNGHVDVVPAGDIKQWNDDPYEGIVKEGKLYGRGSTDMKGGNLSALLAVEALQHIGVKLKGDIIFQSVVEEESGGSGTLAAIERGYRADAALIPEPTNMRLFPKQQGSIWFRVHIQGQSAHGGTRYEGVSGIEKAFVVHRALLSLEQKRNESLTDPLYEKNPIPVPINVGKIEGGNWPSSVPDYVTLEGRLGIIPGESPNVACSELEDHLSKLYQQDEWFNDHPVKVEWFGARWLPGEIDQQHPFFNILSDSFTSITGEPPKVEASPWGTDGGLLTQLADIPVVVFGPGTTNLAHFPNEYIQLDHVFETAQIIAYTLVEWCGVDNI